MNDDLLINNHINPWDYQNDDRIFYKDNFFYDFVTKCLDVEYTSNIVTLELELYSSNKCYLDIEILKTGQVKFNMYPNKTFIRHKKEYMLDAYYENNKFECITDENFIKASLNQLTLEISKNPFIIVLKNLDKVIFKTSTKQVSRQFITPGLGYRINDKQEKQAFLSWDIHSDEAIYGLGEKFSHLNKNGVRSVSYAQDAIATNSTDLSYKSYPYLASLEGYSLLSTSAYKTVFDIGNFCFNSATLLVLDSFLDVCIDIADFQNLNYNFGKLVGKPDPIFEEAFGVWYSRCAYRSFEEVNEISNLLLENGLKFDFLHIDQWFTKQWYHDFWVDCCDFEWNEITFANAKEELSLYRENGVKFSTWINPYLPSGTKLYETALKNDWLVKTTRNQVANVVRKNFDSPIGWIDFTNPNARQFYKENLKIFLEKGILTLKPDYGDRLPENAVFANGKTGLDMHNEYIYEYLKVCDEAIREVHGVNLMWRRPGFLGSTKFPGTWSGDVECTFQGMYNTLRGGLSAAICGEIYWSSDIGGFKGEPTNELYIRWSQMGLLCSLARYHGTTPREPWYFSQTAVDVVKRYTDLRYVLAPYLIKMSKSATRTGMAIMRPMILNFPDDSMCKNIEDQFMLGESILVAPVFRQGAVKRTVYLPQGSWVCMITGKIYEGLRPYQITCGLKDLCLFAKKDDLISISTQEILNLSLLKDAEVKDIVIDSNFTIDNLIKQ